MAKSVITLMWLLVSLASTLFGLTSGRNITCYETRKDYRNRPLRSSVVEAWIEKQFPQTGENATAAKERNNFFKAVLHRFRYFNDTNRLDRGEGCDHCETKIKVDRSDLFSSWILAKCAPSNSAENDDPCASGKDSTIHCSCTTDYCNYFHLNNSNVSSFPPPNLTIILKETEHACYVFKGFPLPVNNSRRIPNETIDDWCFTVYKKDERPMEAVKLCINEANRGGKKQHCVADRATDTVLCCCRGRLCNDYDINKDMNPFNALMNASQPGETLRIFNSTVSMTTSTTMTSRPEKDKKISCAKVNVSDTYDQQRKESELHGSAGFYNQGNELIKPVWLKECKYCTSERRRTDRRPKYPWHIQIGGDPSCDPDNTLHQCTYTSLTSLNLSRACKRCQRPVFRGKDTTTVCNYSHSDFWSQQPLLSEEHATDKEVDGCWRNNWMTGPKIGSKYCFSSYPQTLYSLGSNCEQELTNDDKHTVACAVSIWLKSAVCCCNWKFCNNYMHNPAMDPKVALDKALEEMAITTTAVETTTLNGTAEMNVTTTLNGTAEMNVTTTLEPVPTVSGSVTLTGMAEETTMSSTQEGTTNQTKLMLAAVGGTILLLILLALVAIVCMLCRRQRDTWEVVEKEQTENVPSLSACDEVSICEDVIVMTTEEKKKKKKVATFSSTNVSPKLQTTPSASSKAISLDHTVSVDSEEEVSF